jgi:GNAT superfamily N-acetyltransferase
VIVRRLTSADFEAYMAVRTEGLVQDPQAFRVDLKDDAAVGGDAWRARLDRDYVVGVEQQGRILGIGGFARIPGLKTEHKGLIWGMYVRPEARGTDTANAIMAALFMRRPWCARFS